jgi:UDP-4-amino-4-deoxy-L-arabinose formyltransferase/UDP-glucuronic acid dehydrogenase (UDP-4-keto-hexauronic acid decarboxylating)
MKFAALGRTAILIEAAKASMARGHALCLVGTAAPSPEYTAGERDFAALAQAAGCPFFIESQKPAPEVAGLIEASGAEVAISVNWPRLMRHELRSRFLHGVINAHAGDLPRYRGNACPNWAILNGEPEVVVTLHRMDDGLDSGPVLARRRLPIGDDTYIGDIYRMLNEAIPALFADLLDALQSGRAVEQAQPLDPSLALRCFPRRESDSEIDWSRAALDVARLVRASAEPFAGAYSWLDGRRVRIWRARAATLPYRWSGVPGQVAEIGADAVAVLCGEGVLLLEEIQIEGAGRAPAGRAIRSTRMRFGVDRDKDIAVLARRVADLEARLGKDGSG